MSMPMGGQDIGGNRPMDTRFGGPKPGGAGGFPGGQMKGPSNWQVYYTPEGHPYYYNTMTGHTQWERPAEMDQAPAMPRPGGGGAADANGTASFGPPGSNLFVFHLPSDWTDMDLIQHFQHYGQILSARIQRDANGRNRGFGFVSFDTPLAAANATRGMNGFHVGGKWLKVQLKKGEEHFGVNLPGAQPAQGGPGPRGAGGPGDLGMMGGMGMGGLGQEGPSGGQPMWAQPAQGAPRQFPPY